MGLTTQLAAFSATSLIFAASSMALQPATKTPPQPRGLDVIYPAGVKPPKPGVIPQPRYETDDCWSFQLRAEQAERKSRREQMDWPNLDPSIQEQLWDDLVGPDQLNDGYGVAQVRPSERDGTGFENRDDGFGGRDLLVDFSWNYTELFAGARKLAFDMSLNVDGDVVIAGGLDQSNGVRLQELEGTADATQGAIFNWTSSFTWGSANNPLLFTAAADLYGNTFASGKTGNGNYVINRFDGATGATGSVYNHTVGTEPTGTSVTDMLVDPEGKIYVCGFSTAANGQTQWFAARHEPVAPYTRAWLWTLPGNGRPLGGIRMNRYGEIFVAGGNAAVGSSNTDFTVVKLGTDGVAEWIMTDPSAALGDSVVAMELDFAGDPYVTGQSGTGVKTMKIDRTTQAVVWRASYPTGQTLDLQVDGSGNVYVAGYESSTARIRTIKYNSTGVQQWARGYGTTGAGASSAANASCLALDWLGNPYVVGTYLTNLSNTALIDVRKLNPATGADVWAQTLLPNYDSNENTDYIYIAQILVDAGGSVYVGGNRYGTRGSFAGGEMFVARWEQPYVSIPQIARSTPNLKIENHSVWFPEQEDLGGLAFNQSFSLFSFDVDQLVNETAVDDLLSSELNYVLGTVRGEIDVDLSNNVSLGVNFETSASGGSYDATATGELTIAVPGEGELFAGQPFTVAMSFKPDPAGMEMIANSEPELQASLRSNVTGTLDLDVRGFNRNFGGEFYTVFDQDVPTPALTALDDIALFNVLPPGLPPAGTWANFEIFGVSGRATMPQLQAEGVFDARSTSGTSPGNTSDDDILRMSSSLSETFCEVGVSVTDMLTTAAVGLPLSFGYELPAGGDGTDVGASIGLLQATLGASMKMEQDLTLDMRPYVRLEFPDSGQSPITIDLVKREGTSGAYTYEPESPVNITLPAGTGAMEIKPFFGTRATMRNQSGFRFGATAGFDAFALAANLSVLDVNVFSLDYCLGCISQPITNTRFNIFDRTSPTFYFSGNAGSETEMASIQVAGDVNVQPQLIGASRANARMIIYEQRTPTQAELNAAAYGTEPMVLYGRKFFTGTGSPNRAYIRHHGRTVEMTTTRLNDQSLLVEVPKRFYLLPGFARIWVTNGNGRSETVDFPIEHPFPNFLGIQGFDGDTNPTIWAGDPRWKNGAAIAIDGGTPAGNDSFIARRDYYTLLRTTLWSSALFEPGASNSGLTAQAYFPAFRGWELAGQPKQPPGFPTLVFDGVAAGRHRPFVNDGFFRSALPGGLIASPHFATAQLVNPGPGGGPSRVRTLEIPSPKPVLSYTEPSSYSPGTLAPGATLRLVVYGPDSASSFAGYEGKKAGNFTPESVVRFDGVDVATTFISSGQLVAEIPETALAATGAHLVTVSTPSGGTQYYEQLTTGLGTTLQGGLINSGGVSVPLTFNVNWPTPEVLTVSQSTVTLNTPPYFPTSVDGLPPTDSHNFGITGENFAPGCIVYWNGRVLPSTRVSDRALRVTVSAADVSRLGDARVWVRNPAPSIRNSLPMTVQVVP